MGNLFAKQQDGAGDEGSQGLRGPLIGRSPRGGNRGSNPVNNASDPARGATNLGDPPGSASTSVQVTSNDEIHAPEANGWTWRDIFPLSKKWGLNKKAFAALLMESANLAVSCILTLNIYGASYFISWSDPDGICISNDDVTFSGAFKSTIKWAVIALPFICCPVTVYVSGQAKALEHNLDAVGFVAGLVVTELIYVIAMGYLMTVCMANTANIYILLVTCVIILQTIVSWGCCCFHPKCLRSLVVNRCFCCCPDMIDVEVEDLEHGRVVAVGVPDEHVTEEHQFGTTPDVNHMARAEDPPQQHEFGRRADVNGNGHVTVVNDPSQEHESASEEAINVNSQLIKASDPSQVIKAAGKAAAVSMENDQGTETEKIAIENGAERALAINVQNGQEASVTKAARAVEGANGAGPGEVERVLHAKKAESGTEKDVHGSGEIIDEVDQENASNTGAGEA